MFILIENGEVYAPEQLGPCSVLIAADRIAKIDGVNVDALTGLGIEVDVIDARGCVVTPGLIDPHQHLLGGSGEKGFSTQTPEISAGEIVMAGITTVVGCLGVDTTMKTMSGLLAKAKALKEEGVSAFVWSGGYRTRPATITDDICNDIMFIEEVIGAGEIAISDVRSTEPSPQDLARLVTQAHNGGLLSKKCGMTHFHVGSGERRLKVLREMVDGYDVRAKWLYPTHIGRTDELMLEAIQLAKDGSYVDLDTVDENVAERLRFYHDNTGWDEKLTLSSDASKTGPQNLFYEFRRCVVDEGFQLEQMLKFASANTAAALQLENKGGLKTGADADILVLDKETLDIREVICRGKRLVKDGELAFKEAFLKDSNRDIHLTGDRSNGARGVQAAKS
jgi:beta-aspartyl-dipeptidase (metallo-type)